MRSAIFLLGALIFAGCGSENVTTGDRLTSGPVPSSTSSRSPKGPGACSLIGDELRHEVLGRYVQDASASARQCYWRAVKPTIKGPKARTLHVTVVPGLDGATGHVGVLDSYAYYKNRSTTLGPCEALRVTTGRACLVYPRGSSPVIMAIAVQRGQLAAEVTISGGNLPEMPFGERVHLAQRLAEAVVLVLR